MEYFQESNFLILLKVVRFLRALLNIGFLWVMAPVVDFISGFLTTRLRLMRVDQNFLVLAMKPVTCFWTFFPNGCLLGLKSAAGNSVKVNAPSNLEPTGISS